MRRKGHNLGWANGDQVVQQLLILSDIIHTDIGNKPRTPLIRPTPLSFFEWLFEQCICWQIAKSPPVARS
jgi:hypothetical protein